MNAGGRDSAVSAICRSFKQAVGVVDKPST